MLKASVIGNIGADGDLKYSANGQPMLQLNVASNYRVRDQDGEWSDKTEWVRVTLFGKRAETLSPMLRKGMRIFADGRLEARPWTSRDGDIRAGLEMIANDIEFFSPRNEDGQQPVRRAPAAAGIRPAQGGKDDLEDLPF